MFVQKAPLVAWNFCFGSLILGTTLSLVGIAILDGWLVATAIVSQLIVMVSFPLPNLPKDWGHANPPEESSPILPSDLNTFEELGTPSARTKFREQVLC